MRSADLEIDYILLFVLNFKKLEFSFNVITQTPTPRDLQFQDLACI